MNEKDLVARVMQRLRPDHHARRRFMAGPEAIETFNRCLVLYEAAPETLREAARLWHGHTIIDVQFYEGNPKTEREGITS